MSTARDRALEHAGTHKVSDAFDAPWPGEDRLRIRELGADARMAIMGGMDIDTRSETARIDMSTVLPYVTELIVDADSREPVFEIADHDALVKKYPALVSKTVMTSIAISELGETAAESAEGNS